MDNFLLNSVYLNYILLLLYFLCTNTEAIQGRFFLSHPLFESDSVWPLVLFRIVCVQVSI